MIHSGQLKSGPWLLEASRHEAADEGWQQADWRNAADYGAFNSTSRPATSADIPHPSKMKLSPTAAARAAATEDPENDPYGVLNGSGKNFEGLVNNIVSHHNQASPDTHYEGRVWYPAAHDYVQDLSDKSIHDPNRTAAVFAALSPQNDWDNNVEHGTHFMLNYNGQPGFGMPRILGGNVDKAKQIYHSPDENYDAILSGPKTRSFHHNIMDDTPLREPRPGEADDAGYFQHATNPYSGEQDWRMNPDQDVTADTHHARATSTPHGADLADARYQVPADFSYNAASGRAKLDPGYDLYNRATQEATRRVNAAQPDPARHLTPKQMQAIVWTKFKGDVDAAGKGRDFNPPGVPPKGLQKWLERGKSEAEWAAKNPSVSEHPTIPRYQREHDPDYWTDQYRRPEPDIRHAPGYLRHFPVQKASAVANNGSLWGNILGSYIAKHPQHPEGTVEPQHIPNRPHPEPRRTLAPRQRRRPRKGSWYVEADSSVDISTSGNPGTGDDENTPGSARTPAPTTTAPSAPSSPNATMGTGQAPGATPGASAVNWGAMPDVQMGAPMPSGAAGYHYPGGGSGGQSGASSSSPGAAPGTVPGGPGQAGKPDAQGILPNARPLYDQLMKEFPGATIGGYRVDDYHEHDHGAMDFMTKDPAQAARVRQMAFDAGAPYVLNQQRQWNSDGTSSAMGDRGNATENHFDHVHIAPFTPPVRAPSPMAAPTAGSQPGQKVSRWYKDADLGQPGGFMSGPATPAFAGTFGNSFTSGTGGTWAAAHPELFNHSGGGGGGGGGGASASSPAPSSGGGATSAPAAGSVPLTQRPDGTWTSTNPAWAHLIDRESGGRASVGQGITDANGGPGSPNAAQGLFQFTPATWAGAGGSKYGPNPGQATPQQQAEIAGDLIRKNPSGSDWGAGLPGREDAGALGAGLSSTTSGPPPITGSIHSGHPKSGPYLLAASAHMSSQEMHIDDEEHPARDYLFPQSHDQDNDNWHQVAPWHRGDQKLIATHDDALVGDPQDEKHRQDDMQDQPFTASRQWYRD